MGKDKRKWYKKGSQDTYGEAVCDVVMAIRNKDRENLDSIMSVLSEEQFKRTGDLEDLIR